MATHTIHVAGISLWAPRLPGWGVAAPVLRGEAPVPEAAAARPAPTLLAPTERRRAPDTVAIALEVAARACQSAGVEPREVASVFATTHGDLAINDYMSETLARTPAMVSPIRFHNSVLNAAAGYWSIGTGSMQPYTALTAWEDTFGEGLLEAMTQAEAGGRPTLLVAYDIEARGPLSTVVTSHGVLGVGVVLAPTAGPGVLARVHWRTTRGTERTAPLARNLAAVADNAMAGCMPFCEAVAMRQPRMIRVGLSPTLLLEMEFDFPESP